tara:strand:- start:1149 stop:1670 length:522 start_codon:yes stop_codon:yes gene_type:complete
MGGGKMEGIFGKEVGTVTLTPAEMLIAGQLGLMRMVQNLRDNRKGKYGAPTDSQAWAINILGAMGEACVAKWGGLWWSGSLGDYKADDAGKLQVRTVDKENKRLILHDDDKDDRPYILVYAKPPSFIIKGWIMGADGKDKAYWADPQRTNRHAYFVPNDKLININELELSIWL